MYGKIGIKSKYIKNQGQNTNRKKYNRKDNGWII